MKKILLSVLFLCVMLSVLVFVIKEPGASDDFQNGSQTGHKDPAELLLMNSTVDKTFDDIAVTDWYYDAVQWAVKNDIVAGSSATTFSPDAPCTRAQVVTFLWRAAGSPIVENDSNTFTDVPVDAYYSDAVQWAISHGITAGASADTFLPDKPCTRGQAITFLYRAEKSPAANGKCPFVDVPVGAFYTDAVCWAVDNGVVACANNITFDPNSTCTRGQIVSFLYRAKEAPVDTSNKSQLTLGAAESLLPVDYIGLTVNDIIALWGPDIQYIDGWLFGGTKQFYYQDTRSPLFFGFTDPNVIWDGEGKANGTEEVNYIECYPQIECKNPIKEIAPGIPSQINADQLARLDYKLTDESEFGFDEFGAEMALSIDYSSEIRMYFMWSESSDANSHPANLIAILSKSAFGNTETIETGDHPLGEVWVSNGYRLSDTMTARFLDNGIFEYTYVGTIYQAEYKIIDGKLYIYDAMFISGGENGDPAEFYYDDDMNCLVSTNIESMEEQDSEDEFGNYIPAKYVPTTLSPWSDGYFPNGW